MPTYKCVMRGKLPSGEVWNSGFHASTLLPIADVVSSFLNFCSGLWGSNVNGEGISHLFSTSVGLTGSTVYELDRTTGRALDKVDSGQALNGTATGLPLPQEVAEVVTLMTANNTRRGHGRMYFPPFEVSHLTVDGRIPAASCYSLAQAVGHNMNNMVIDGVGPILFTVGHPDRPIVMVNCGDVFDAQRRRRDSLVEARVNSTPIATPLAMTLAERGTALPL